jgi:VIT1/CCC1 family predicted Fe2+/Mn2+ transporter
MADEQQRNTQGPAPAAKHQPAPNRSGLLRESVFGINDGLVATIGLVSGEALSHQPHHAVVIAAVSAVGAAVVSMAVGSYLATVSENDFIDHQIRRQSWTIARHPERARQRVRRLLDELGVPRPALATVEANIVRDRPRWLKFMVREHLGIHENRKENPWHNALAMGGAVIVGSTPPVLPYLLDLSTVAARNLSWALSLAAALSLGAIKGRITGSSMLANALSFGALVSLSATVGALIGLGLGQAAG